MLTATKPMQLVCLYPLEMTTLEGDAYVYMFIDAFSDFLMVTGIEKKEGDPDILKHIALLTQNKDFSAHSCKPFLIVLHKYAGLLPAINALLAPLGGGATVSDETVAYYMAPALEAFYKNMAKKSLD